MKTIEKICTIYQAFDGNEFTNYEECENYEAEKAKEVRVNLRNFDIQFPMQDNFGYCRAYLVHSENEFEMLKAYIHLFLTYASEFSRCSSISLITLIQRLDALYAF